MSTRKRVPGCLQCQERHVKCDRARPTCSSCRNLKYPAICEYGSRHLRFRQSRFSSALARNDATRCEANSADVSVEGLRSDGTGLELPRSSSTIRMRGSSPRSSPLSVSGNSPMPTPLPPLSSSLELSPGGLTPAHPAYGIGGSPSTADLTQTDASLGVQKVFSHATPHHPLPGPPRPLTKELDCRVFAFYVEHAGKWIDIGSPGGHFQSGVPQLALSSDLLLAACLSCASNLMHLLGMLEKRAEQDYSDLVVSLMIPSLSSERANSSNEALLATVVILRMSEQFLELSSDAQRHLQGAASLFLDGTDWSPIESNLATSCFWTYMRESIRISFLQERPCPFELGHLSLCDDDMTRPAVNDGVWTNRITYLLVQVGSLCWGQVQQHPTEQSRRLSVLLDNWRTHLPPSFQPWGVCEREGRPFPEIRVLAPWHVVGWQFYYTAKVMLAVHYPDVRSGQSLHDVHRYIETAVVAPTRLLCGLCMSNTNNVGTNLNGSHLMAWCGRFLSGRAEQQCLLNFLTDFGHHTKWPIDVECRRLEESWATATQSWVDSTQETPGY